MSSVYVIITCLTASLCLPADQVDSDGHGRDAAQRRHPCAGRPHGAEVHTAWHQGSCAASSAASHAQSEVGADMTVLH